MIHVAYRPRIAPQRPVRAFITPRQAECLDGLIDGLSNAQIGVRLDITEDTVKHHLKVLYKTIGANDRAHAVGLVLTGRVTVLVRDPGGERAA